jgi:hypothetical protein
LRAGKEPADGPGRGRSGGPDAGLDRLRGLGDGRGQDLGRAVGAAHVVLDADAADVREGGEPVAAQGAVADEWPGQGLVLRIAGTM